jgi:hypothetical protein
MYMAITTPTAKQNTAIIQNGECQPKRFAITNPMGRPNIWLAANAFVQIPSLCPYFHFKNIAYDSENL